MAAQGNGSAALRGSKRAKQVVVAILEALREAGSLRAEIIVI